LANYIDYKPRFSGEACLKTGAKKEEEKTIAK